MQNNTVLKLGMAALLSVMMTACASNDTEDTAAPVTATPAASTSGAGNGSGLSAAEIAKRDAALAKKVFYFEFDRAELSAEDRDALVYHATDLKANPSKRIRLEGHADERGTREYNLALGERRAQAIERYLQVQGVAAGQMETISYGEEMPTDTRTTEAAYSVNRRVEMK
ncbi:MAG: peptidoglycan-associated lipoprotein Pal [Pseudomonadota bacterium]